MSFEEQMQQKVHEVELKIQAFLPAEEGFQKTVFEAMNYSVLAGGKRLRPLLMAETFKMLGGTDEKLLAPFMAALEMIHTYSLVHDDLPAMDNDEYRRGRKTTWVTFGEDMGILAGDALLNFAFETAGKAFDAAENEEELRRAAKALSILSKKAGVYGMIGGQVVDVQLSGKPIEKDVLDFIYAMKTGALIEAAMMIGGALAGADAQVLQKIESIALKTGLAFQIEDDILDVTSTLEVLGKLTHSDEKNEKTTYVTLYGIEKAQEEVKQLSHEAVSLLDELGGRDTFLEALILSLIHRKK